MVLSFLFACAGAPEIPKLTPSSSPSWSGPEPALVVERGSAAPVGVSATSTASVRYKEAGVEHLRMFGVGSHTLNSQDLRFDMPPFPQACGPKKAAAYLEWFKADGGEFRYSENVGSPSVKTCVSALDEASTQRVRVRTSHKPMKEEVREVELQARYGGPSVVYVPDLGWVLVMSRIRREAGAKGPQSPSNSLSDVVGWLSPSGAFDRDVKGPVLLVDDFDAVPDQVHRNWLGVPGITLLSGAKEDTLLIHYAASIPQEPYIDGTDAYPPPTDLEVGAAAKTIRIGDLRRAFDGKKKGPPKAAEGEVLGLVRVWVATGGTAAAPEVVSHGSLYEFPWHAVDPQPIVCEKGLQLFFANLPRGASAAGLGADTGLGIWHAAGIDSGVVLKTPSGSRTAVEGVDFVVRPAGSNGLSADQVAPASEDVPRVYIDPDPVRMADGSFNVYAGTWDKASLMRFQGPSDLGCRSWKDAFAR
ncbi:MAG: hypothetical protein GY913_20110 [Proteobacteria bacterium]|nr:hypothetical protein [Pseudomonadota bacterium]MCP4919211.1 hypothetical protein [Pseudomonadota bacterium]